ncbi:unnamed protein product [Rhizoctonia solani]|uniref:Uncharacterized protein n=1 Tax=Rhizoctonia solani TaxID=456999 RepID=A0A8H3H5G4_9AGAM|nr:unnamed protein product [Rhizoctonia solani]
MSLTFPYTPFPFDVTAISPLFHLSPVSSNTSLGWAPSCTTPECISTTSWSTSAINSTLSFQYRGVSLAFDGHVEGNMSVQLFCNGVEVAWSPSGDTLFNLWGEPGVELHLQNITLQVLDASPGAQLTVSRARVNGSSFGDGYFPTSRWTVPSDDDKLRYTGFIPQTSVVQTNASTTYVSSSVGDTVSMQFNGSTFLVYGPCGPTNGLMKVTIDGQQQTVNTSKPLVSNDCLLFQAWGLPTHSLHQLFIENASGGALGIDRFDFFKLQLYEGPDTSTRTIVVACVVMAAIVVSAVVIVVRVRRSVKRMKEGDEPLPNPRWLKLLCL